MKFNYLLSFFLWSSLVFSQASFTDQTSMLGSIATNSGAPIAICDMNNDQRDDIVILDQTTNLVVYYNNQGSFTRYVFGAVSGSSWAMALGDTNNDGYTDILTGGSYDAVKHLNANGDGTYGINVLTGPSIFVQGSAMADIDNDGFLDAMNCHDDGPNVIWSNDGNGNLIDSGTGLIDFNLFPTTEENAGNYGITWSDVDLDGDTDLYISKCRLGVTSVTDPRRVNQLWINNGSNVYTERALNFGLAVGAQSWVSDFQDIDNDGDLDVFIANHDVNSQLFENVSGSYVDITASSGIVASGGTLIQASMKDMDNDGFVDILTSGKYFKNNGDKTFTEVTNPFGSNHTFAFGDINEDGFIDAIIGYGSGYNSPGATDDKLWINDRNDNHFLSINLIGVMSNKSAVGSVIELKGDWGTMVRELRAGESYGINHSFTQQFGLGSDYEIESLTIKWPSGKISSYTNILANQLLTIPESGCDPINVAVTTNGRTTLCQGENVELSIDTDLANSVLWSTGSTTNSIMVNGAGDYNVTVTGQNGCRTVSKTITVIVDDVLCLDPCELNYDLHGNISGEIYKAQTFIKSISSISNVEFHAEDFIELQSGFEVTSTNTFLAEMDGCN